MASPPFLSIARRRFDPLEPIYLWVLLFAYVYLVKPVARILTGEPFLYGLDQVRDAIGLAAVGLAAFYGGYFSRLGVALASHVPMMRKDYSASRLRAVAWCFIVIGALGLWRYMAVSGGWRVFWSQPHGYGGQPDQTTAYVYQLPELMVVGFFLLIADAMTRMMTPGSLIRVVIGSLGGVGVYSILWSRRTLVGWASISVFTVYFRIKRRRPSPAAIAVFVGALFVSITVLLALRPYLHLGASAEDIRNINIVRSAVTTVSSTGDEFDSLLAIMSLYPEPLPHDYFKLYAQIPLHPIPRFLWPDKPTLFISTWDDFLYRSGIGVGASEGIVGDFYVQLGVAGVLVGMAASGVLFRTLIAYLRRGPDRLPVQLFYAVALGNIPSFIMQGAVSAFWKWMPLMLPGIVVAFAIAGIRRARPLPHRGLSPIA